MSISEISQLKNLDFTKQLAFAYLTCERLYPNYVHFSDNYNFGKPSLLREAIDYLYRSLFESSPDKGNINCLAKQLEKNTPDTENYTTIFVSSALDACSVIYESLSFLLDRQPSRLDSISTIAVDSVYMHIEVEDNLDNNVDKDLKNHKINNHSLMKKELAMQSGIITFLCNTKTIDSGDLQTLLHLQENNKKGTLDL